MNNFMKRWLGRSIIVDCGPISYIGTLISRTGDFVEVLVFSREKIRFHIKKYDTDFGIIQGEEV